MHTHRETGIVEQHADHAVTWVYYFATFEKGAKYIVLEQPSRDFLVCYPPLVPPPLPERHPPPQMSPTDVSSLLWLPPLMCHPHQSPLICHPHRVHPIDVSPPPAGHGGSEVLDLCLVSNFNQLQETGPFRPVWLLRGDSQKLHQRHWGT